MLFDATPADGAFGALGAFLEAADPAATTPSVADRRGHLVTAVERAFGPNTPDLIDYVEQDWAEDPWARGCVSRPEPGTLAQHGAHLRSAYGRIHFAGAETARQWDGHVDGAVRSGHDAARAVDALLG